MSMEGIMKESAKGFGDIEGHKALIAGIVLAMGKTTIIETGVREGHSTDALLAAAVMVGSEVVSIDMNATPYTPTTQEASAAWTFMQADALLALVGLSSTVAGACGVIMLDDWHSGGHVAAELELCKRLVSPNHIIAVHDAMWCNSQPRYNSRPLPSGDEFEGGGPCGAISELDKDEWEYVTVPAHNGLTLLRYKGATA